MKKEKGAFLVGFRVLSRAVRQPVVSACDAIRPGGEGYWVAQDFRAIDSR